LEKHGFGRLITYSRTVLDPEDDASALVWVTQRSFGWGGEAVLQNWPSLILSRTDH